MKSLTVRAATSLIVLLLPAFFAGGAAAADRAVPPTGLTGYVLDSTSTPTRPRPVAGATVSVIGRTWRAKTDSTGKYVLNGGPGRFTIRAVGPNHFYQRKAMTMAYGRVLRLNFQLVRLAAGMLDESGRYMAGAPRYRELWIDPLRGSDGNSGLTRTLALKTVRAAWQRIPRDRVLTVGYRVNLVAATYGEPSMPDNCWFEERRGSFKAPVVFRSADGPDKARLPAFQLFDCRFVYLDGVRVSGTSDYSLHVSSCSYVLLRRTNILGVGDIASYSCPQESLKCNQCRNLYVEDSDISGSWNVSLDFVACRDGHIIGNRIHRAGDWACYLKGGSARYRVEGNEFYDAGNGGFSAGQGAGLEFMVSPYLHYEAYDIKFVNNIVHDVAGAGVGVNGGFNVLLAYNTMYRVGKNSHAVEVTFGQRSCDGQAADCAARLAAGGWGTDVPFSVTVQIPSRNVYIFNNVVYNVTGYTPQWSHFYLPATGAAEPASNVPSPVRADTGLLIRGNYMWDPPADLALGLGDATEPDAVEATVLARNSINVAAPEFANFGGGDLRPLAGGNLARSNSWAIPAFPGTDYPQSPAVAAWKLVNAVPVDRNGISRTPLGPPGAYAR